MAQPFVPHAALARSGRTWGFALSKEFLQGIFMSGSLKPERLIYPSGQPSERNTLLPFVNNLMHSEPLFWWLGAKLKIDLTGKLSS